ncbi:transcriptional repressor LexA [Corynebacterium sp. SCR221107]|uniref:transcriptional repressor LexA n=1 Tax=Corynebacterium sp. SCR221107 TaxID=3017361 RepID=UPI0022EC5B87|nr:transcriptional repressor LexA [Corynebacterium sp. SCR221107]WBT07852.1 transcriptional repressor LexA [Corynebacterium sp. SCR221107]
MSPAKKSSESKGRGLTDRQRRILEVINDAVVLRGYPPSIREIGDAAGLQSTSSVAYQLKELEKKGYLRRDPNKPRAVDVRVLPEVAKKPGKKTTKEVPTSPIPEELASQSSGISMVPVVGSIAAGAPILAEENVSTYFPLPTDIVGEGDLFTLEVVGDSMIDAGILNGDWVVVRSQPAVEQGEFAAALIDGEATVKEFFRDDSGIYLLPHNPAYDPIDGTHAIIMGKVVSVMRKL